MKISLDATVHVSGLDDSEADYEKARELFDKILIFKNRPQYVYFNISHLNWDSFIKNRYA